MAGILLSGFGSGDPQAAKSVLAFVNRVDLTTSTRVAMLHGPAILPELPEEVGVALERGLDDREPRVRAAAVIAFAHSASTFHRLAKDRVERMANDLKEHPQVRELAKKALAGETFLNPNIDVTLK
jgi:hypothetical protein